MTSEETLLILNARNRALSKLKAQHADEFEVFYKAELRAIGVKRRQDMTKAELKEYEVNRLKAKLKDLQG